MAKKNKAPKYPFHKYKTYEASVQAPDADIEFIEKTYQEIHGRKPFVLREDFCGSAALCIEWAKNSKKHMAIGIDLDSEPLAYAQEKVDKLPSEELKNRIRLLKQDVLESNSEKADVIVAFNYSFYIFKQREKLRSYFKTVRKSLGPRGLFMLDCFGGIESQETHEDKRRVKDFTYFFECSKFNPITHDCFYAIHFKPRGKKKYRNVFTYDWRMWTAPEIQEILIEAGFSKAHVFWEGETRKGEGNGKFAISREEENCLCWLAYIVGVP